MSIQPSTLQAINRVLGLTGNAALHQNSQRLFLTDIKSIFEHAPRPLPLEKQKQFRLISVVLQGALQRKEIGKGEKANCKKLIDIIEQECGTTPRLNNATIRFPAKQYRPEGMRSGKTFKVWKTIPWEDPQRSRGASTQVVHFFTGAMPVLGEPATAAVRQDLIAQADTSALSGKLFSYVDREFFVAGNLHADHLQASTDILERQREMIEAMNLDQTFRKEMLDDPQSEGCFLVVDPINEEIVGTKYFYMLYHNCIDNLWLMSPAANSGAGKSAQDAIAWLRTQKFGPDFLALVEPISRRGILYETKHGELLGSAAAKFVNEKYAEALEVIKRAEDLAGTLRNRALEIADDLSIPSPLRQRSALMADTVMAESSAKMRTSLSRLDFSQLTQADMEITEGSLTLMRNLAPQTPLRDSAKLAVSRFKFKKYQTTPNAKDVVVSAGELMLNAVRRFISESAQAKIPPQLRLTYAQRAVTDLQTVLGSQTSKRPIQQPPSTPVKRQRK